MKSITVADLIKQLQELPQDALVAKVSHNFELKGALVGVRGVSLFAGRIEKEKFTDAFDYIDYETEVIRRDNGTMKFVELNDIP